MTRAARRRTAERAEPGAHIVSMTIEHIDYRTSYSVATCRCGWINRVKRAGADCYRAQDEAIDAHQAEARR